MDKGNVQSNLAPPPPAYHPTSYAMMTATVQPGFAVTMVPGQAATPSGNQARYDVIPVRIICQHCQEEVLTKVTSRVGLISFLICGGLIFVGCVAGCCLIPFCVSSLKDTIHKCPKCHLQVGVHKSI